MIKNIVTLRFLLFAFLGPALTLVVSCSGNQATGNENENAPADSSSVSTAVESIPVMLPDTFSIMRRALLEAYPSQIKDVADNKVVMQNGATIVFDDGQAKDFLVRLDNSDVEDMFFDIYQVPDSAPPYLYDPGRSRSEELYKAMYGHSAAEVERNLTSVEWFGQNVKFTSINGGADSLRAVARDIQEHPGLAPYLKSSGTFYWRPVRGSNRMSAHSYGIAFDIGVDKSDYWQWKSGSNDELKKVDYSNRIPREIVEIFQRHGFIWGGAWYHFDTMHFEFRPELLLYSKLINQTE